FFTDTPTTEIYTLSLHDALPISPELRSWRVLQPYRWTESDRLYVSAFTPAWWSWEISPTAGAASISHWARRPTSPPACNPKPSPDRKSTRLNSSHDQISYAVFCL